LVPFEKVTVPAVLAVGGEEGSFLGWVVDVGVVVGGHDVVLVVPSPGYTGEADIAGNDLSESLPEVLGEKGLSKNFIYYYTVNL
jgi:hypothetical protein